MNYYFHKTVHLPFAEAEEKIRESLASRNFGILTEIDMQATFKKKLDKDIRPHKILGACNPNYAYQATQAEEKMSTLLPCNVTVSENEDGTVDITMMDPVAAFSLIENPEVEPIAKEVKGILLEALNKVA